MRFAARAFAFCLVPFTLVLGVSFWMLRTELRTNARQELLRGSGEERNAFHHMLAAKQSEAARILRAAGEDTEFKDSLRRLNADSANLQARGDLEAQLRDLSQRTGFPLLSIQNREGVPVGRLARDGNADSVPLAAGEGLAEYGGQLYQVYSAPLGDTETGGSLIAGEDFNIAQFGMPLVLMKGGRIVQSSMALESGQALAACGASPECEFRAGKQRFVSARLDEGGLGAGYVLRTVQPADGAAPLERLLNAVFLTALMGAILSAFIAGRGASASMRVDAGFHSRVLVELPPNRGRIAEIRDLIDKFNRAASSIREARHGLQSIYIEFAGSLANALDARDGYTANHSQRVSQIAIDIAQAVHLPPQDIEALRIGALLHDIGKIGIPDYILQKPGVLSDAEFALIRQHPIIGCRILEGVKGFSPYLPVVELHHENWDGTGYPYGLKGKDVPLASRIVHIADAWDAMTSDRPYRRGFTHRRALSIIQQNAGTQFDPEIADVFLQLMGYDGSVEAESMMCLAGAIETPEAAANISRAS